MGRSRRAAVHLVVFLSAPAAARVARLRQREIDKFGAEALDANSLRHRQIEAFLRWAAAYDTASGTDGWQPFAA
jgi:cytidylate kinase